MEHRIITVLESMEEMGSLHLESLKDPVHRELVKDTVTKARKCEAVTTNLATQLTALETAYADEVQASLLWEAHKKLTKEVYELSDKRSLAQTALKSALRGVMGLADPQKVAAATTLFELMHKYDLHTGQNVDEQTGVIESFLTDVEQQFAAELQLTGQTELYNGLKTLNELVCAKVVERDESVVGRGTAIMQNARAATDKAWREFRRAVNSYAYVQHYEGYTEFIGYMNVLILRYKRVHLGQTAQSPEGTPGETVPPTDGEQQPETNPDDTPDNSEGSEDSGNQGGGTGGGNTNPGGGYVPPSNGGGFD